MSNHPRRLPTHLAACLRHEGPGSGEVPPVGRERQDLQSGQNKYAFPRISAISQSDRNNNTSDSTGLNVQKWFDRSNHRPEASFHQAFDDDEPPYFLQQDDSSTSNDISDSYRQHTRISHDHVTNGSSADDFRSIIDDLTLENKRLKERLSKYETSHSSHLDKVKLFEVKIHALPGRKKRELEDTLRAFASSFDISADETNSKIPARGRQLPHISLDSAIGSVPKHTSSSSTSNSRPIDSADASMSISGPTSSSTFNHVTLEGKTGPQSRIGKEQKIQSFLHNIPEGIFPKHSPVMTERQKKKIVVRRLEQLFTGETGSIDGEHNQPLQQQVSRSAASADRTAYYRPAPMEGIREAQMLPADIEVVGVSRGKLPRESSNDTQTLRLSDSIDDTSHPTSPEQRPTRPLDLDPNRVQIPSDNMEYIRHLGLSTPKLVPENSGDAGSDAEGWIYLNLLINMAQLHIINVTPDFVRSAVADVSEKLQLSRDGKKIRWRGDTECTRLGSDSGASSAQNRSPQGSDSLDEAGKKRRKANVGRFASVPIDVLDPVASVGVSGPSDSFHYKPLFHHRSSPSWGLVLSDESDSPPGYSLGNESGRIPRPHIWTGRSRSGSPCRRRRDDGPIVFYSGAQFFTDLSGDRGHAATPLYVTSVGKDGDSNRTKDALGSDQRNIARPFLRTPSGSSLPFRPFKDYSKGPQSLQAGANRSHTPELLTGNPKDLDFSMSWSKDDSGPSPSLQVFNASGLGGTQPADHFAVRVETRRTKLPAHKVVKPARFSGQSLCSRRFGHIISKSSLDSFRDPELNNTAESITSGLTDLASFSSPPPQVPISAKELLVKTEFISAHFVRLQPSELPEPSAYYNATSSSEDESNFGGSSFSGISHLRHDKSYLQRSLTSPSDRDVQFTGTVGLARKAQRLNNIGDDDMSEESDGSIDMLSQAREIDSETVADGEQEFKWK